MTMVISKETLLNNFSSKNGKESRVTKDITGLNLFLFFLLELTKNFDVNIIMTHQKYLGLHYFGNDRQITFCVLSISLLLLFIKTISFPKPKPQNLLPLTIASLLCQLLANLIAFLFIDRSIFVFYVYVFFIRAIQLWNFIISIRLFDNIFLRKEFKYFFVQRDLCMVITLFFLVFSIQITRVFGNNLIFSFSMIFNFCGIIFSVVLAKRLSSN